MTSKEDKTGASGDPQDFYLLHIPGGSVVYLRASDDVWMISDRRTYRVDLEREQSHLDLWVEVEGKRKPRTFESIYDEWGRRLVGLEYTYDHSLAGCRDAPNRGVILTLACAKLDSQVIATFDAECEEWLREFGAGDLDLLLDWIATAPFVTRPTAALYLQGRDSTGKGMLAEAVARLWGGPTTKYEDAVGRFNSSLLASPVVFLNEGMAGDSKAFRRLVGDNTHRIEQKYRPVGTLKGCPRVIIAANNSDALGLSGENMTNADADAVAIRLVRIRIGEGAARFLGERGGFTLTGKWVDDNGQPGRLVNHLAHIVTSRKVEPGPRFLVQGKRRHWWTPEGERDSSLDSLCSLIAAAVATGGIPDALWILEGEVLVSATGFHRFWQRLDAFAPRLARLVGALQRASNGRNPTRLPAALNPARPRVYRLERAAVLLAGLEDPGIDNEALRDGLGLPPSNLSPPKDPQGCQGI